MVDAYNSDNLKAKSSEYDPYSELNLSRRNLDEKLADWASTVRSQCKTEQEVHEYLSKNTLVHQILHTQKMGWAWKICNV